MGETAVGEKVPEAAVGLREGLVEGPDVNKCPPVGLDEGVVVGCWLTAGIGGEDCGVEGDSVERCWLGSRVGKIEG